MTDLKNLSIDELIKLKTNIDNELNRRERKEKAKAKRMIVELSQKHSINLDKLAVKTKVYINPENPWEKWGGRGRKPNWLIKALKDGKTLEDLEG